MAVRRTDLYFTGKFGKIYPEGTNTRGRCHYIGMWKRPSTTGRERDSQKNGTSAYQSNECSWG